ncbi:MAG: hypothetical protein ABIS45_16055 [Burkholderiales bacterium]
MDNPRKSAKISGTTGVKNMEHQHDEAFLMGQIASMIAVMSALVQALPATTRKRLLQQLRPQFESLIAGMHTTGITDVQTERKGAEWVRDFFFRQIEKADQSPKTRKALPAAPDSVDILL